MLLTLVISYSPVATDLFVTIQASGRLQLSIDNMASHIIIACALVATELSYFHSNSIPVSEENLSARPMCPGGHIFLGNFVLPDRIYCPF